MRGTELAAAALIVVSFISGCSSDPIVSDEWRSGSATREEQLAWIETEVDAVVQATGEPDGWRSGEERLDWTEDRAVLLEQIETESCRPNRADPQPGRRVFTVEHTDIGAPFAAAARVRAVWTSEGWDVSDVLDPESTGTQEDYFRADRSDGAILALDATEHSVILSVSTACSQLTEG